MTALIFSALFPLQIKYNDFSFGKGGGTPTDPKKVLIFWIVVVVVIAVVLIVNAVRKKSPGARSSGGGGKALSGLFSGFALRRLAGDIGLDHDQMKMLDFVFRTDEVTDPEKSLNTPVLLDRHFRRAYRVIEQNSGSDEEIQNRLFVLFSTRNVLESSVSGGLNSTKELKSDITAIITHGKDKYNLPVLAVKTEHIAVECPKNALGSLIKIPKGERLSVMVFTKNEKGFLFESRVLGHSGGSGHTAMLLAHSNQVKFLSKRRYRRKQTDIACNSYLVYVEGSGKKQRLVVDKKRITGNIADVSVGGCSLKTRTPINVGSKLKIEFTQGDNNNVAALGQVLRINRSGGATITHVKFLRVSRKSMNLINAFVYEYSNA